MLVKSASVQTVYSPSVSLLNNLRACEPPSILPIILVSPEAIFSNQIGIIASPDASATIGNTISAFPVLKDVKLVDYKVRILTPNQGTEAVIRVMIESVDKDMNRWSTVGVSTNVIDASYIALRDSLSYKLFRTNTRI